MGRVWALEPHRAALLLTTPRSEVWLLGDEGVSHWQGLHVLAGCLALGLPMGFRSLWATLKRASAVGPDRTVVAPHEHVHEVRLDESDDALVLLDADRDAVVTRGRLWTLLPPDSARLVHSDKGNVCLLLTPPGHQPWTAGRLVDAVLRTWASMHHDCSPDPQPLVVGVPAAVEWLRPTRRLSLETLRTSARMDREEVCCLALGRGDVLGRGDAGRLGAFGAVALVATPDAPPCSVLCVHPESVQGMGLHLTEHALSTMVVPPRCALVLLHCDQRAPPPVCGPVCRHAAARRGWCGGPAMDDPAG